MAACLMAAQAVGVRSKRVLPDVYFTVSLAQRAGTTQCGEGHDNPAL